ncbi:MAG TPA: hypothetical protein P5110_05410 [Candidatus Omnitrophota bacterium]|nr:hypothetical protein [Candidatus Omnitrophota bacterium]
MRINRWKETLRSERGVSLIVVIFVIMLLGVMGWALMSMQSVDFEMSWRNLDSERALDVAESGLQEALNRISTGSAEFNNDTKVLNRTLESGQYVVTRTTVNSNISVLSTGYVPAQANYRAMRQLGMLITSARLDKVVQAHNRFNWTDISGSSSFNGTIQAAWYNGDDVLPDNQQSSDITPIPRTGSSPAPVIGATPYPRIDMAGYQQEAASSGTVWTPPRTGVISSKTDLGTGKTQLVFTPADMFKSPHAQFEGQALRNISRGHWDASYAALAPVTSNVGNQRADVDTIRVNGWQVGDRVMLIPAIAPAGGSGHQTLTHNNTQKTIAFHLDCEYDNLAVGDAVRNLDRANDSWSYDQWGTVTFVEVKNRLTNITVRVDSSVNLTLAANQWQVGDLICAAKLYDDTWTVDQNIVYVQADTVFNVASFINAFSGTSIISEGDIGIKGTGMMLFSQRPDPYPALATKNGNISSPDLPNWILRLLGLGRVFDTLIYSETGDIFFTFLYGTAVVGNNVTLVDKSVVRYNAVIAQAPHFIMDMIAQDWQDE